jgi:hypothetical protein
MKPENLKVNDPQLSRLLQTWPMDEPLPPRFQERVWKRIAAAESKTVPPAAVNWLAILFARPAFATACAALLLVAGLTTGFLRANHDAAHLNTELAQRYVASIDPYTHQNH